MRDDRWRRRDEECSRTGAKSGRLSQDQVVRALIKTFALSQDLRAVSFMRNTVVGTWAAFDTNGTGFIERADFVKRDQLGDTIIATTQYMSQSDSKK